MSPDLAYETYRSEGRSEWMMRIGAVDAPPILIVPPLFEEMNRLRALLASAMRALAARGHGCWLPDLMGSGESAKRLGHVGWDDWRHDVNAASIHVARRSGRPPIVAAFRGGCLLDDAADAAARWRMAPVPGRSLVRDMLRSGLAGVEWAGYAPSDDLRSRLELAEPGEASPLRIVRLASDAGAADAKLAGPALWRRSEPSGSAPLAQAIAADLDQWSRACAVS